MARRTSRRRFGNESARRAARIGGYTLVEVLIALAIGSVVVAGLAGVTRMALATHAVVSEKEELTRQARFAMDQMVRTVSRSRLLILPLHDKPATNWPENIREQTWPHSPPVGDSVFASAVLVVTLPIDQDLDADGFPDADDDRDGRIDEDLYNDAVNDTAPGIWGVDDDGDGFFDEDGLWWWDEDETSAVIDEDPLDGVDNDADQNVDEDPGADSNGDGCPGICGVDDDGDGLVDEGSNSDDDEDGNVDEDWYNPVLFGLVDDVLWTRIPVPWDETGAGGVTGRDFVARPIAEFVSRFRVERLPAAWGDPQLVDLTLELTGPMTGEQVMLQTRVRVGGGL